MIQIRRNVFETNSSSVHSITLCNKSEYDDWKKGKLYMYNSTYKLPSQRSHFFSWGDMIDFIKDNFNSYDDIAYLVKAKKEENDTRFESLLTKYDFFTFDAFEEFLDSFEYETASIKTPSGDEVIAFSYYGYDG